ncbi:hypothetical protein TWF102_009113 [Orbilia oligospora]|uniref:C2H2-type domain-containing protein n=1 Tax=Orbilia oligospora TaxID=2813651 RepID=A0A7C8NFU4_ORBOL|nr:hypothetical protein TWF103_005950 [Orbilia oligospora]KAF3109844.1 hypothetical protein TWF102_009113 [Orbilia oligospora]KAF3116922.1 hypothetical protein TWF706_000138 [Orbilia oligospora]KAF3142251.1 hypothetical protein TWF594_005611 [Orbilia oligospora]
MEPNRQPQALDHSSIDLLSSYSCYPPPPLLGQSEPWMLMAVPELTARSGSENISLQKNYPSLQPSIIQPVPSSSPIPHSVTNLQLQKLEVDSQDIVRRVIKGQDSLDLGQIKNLSLSDHQGLIQNPKVTKLDIRDQIALHEALVEKLNAEYRSRVENLQRSLHSGSSEIKPVNMINFHNIDEVEPKKGKGKEELLRGLEELEQKPFQLKRSNRLTDIAKFCCTVEDCDKTFGRNSDRERHERTVHIHGGSGPNRLPRKRYVCLEPSCKRSEEFSGLEAKEFSRKDNAKAHVTKIHKLHGLDAAKKIGEREILVGDLEQTSEGWPTTNPHEPFPIQARTHKIFSSKRADLQADYFSFESGLNAGVLRGNWRSDARGELSSQTSHGEISLDNVAVSGCLLPSQRQCSNSLQLHQKQSDITLLGEKKLISFARKEFGDDLANTIDEPTAPQFRIPEKSSGVITIGYVEPGVEGV